MRDYCMVSPNFWIGETGKKLIAEGHECALVAMYLITSPSANAYGNYYLPVNHIAYATSLPLDQTYDLLKKICAIGFCSYDDASEVVWVHEMAKFQIGDEFKEADNRVKFAISEYGKLPKSPFLYDIYLKYKDVFYLKKPRGIDINSIPPLKGGVDCLTPPSKQEQEQEQEQDKRNTNSSGAQLGDQPSAPSVVSFKKNSSKHFRQRFESVLVEIKQACNTIQSLPVKEKPFNPFQAVQKAVNDGMHPDSILYTLRQMTEGWDSGTIKNPWAWWRSVLFKHSQNTWEKENMAQAEGYKKAITDLASQKDFLSKIGLNIKTIGSGKPRSPDSVGFDHLSGVRSPSRVLPRG